MVKVCRNSAFRIAITVRITTKIALVGEESQL
jgi:hypothetical protein